MSIRMIKQEPIPGLKESREWIRNNAHMYRGQWIAVYNGNLIGSALTVKELKKLIDPSIPMYHTIVVKVLEESD